MFRLAFAAALAALALGVPVENGVEGDPEIECGPTSITVNFNTQNEFEGHVYVKGLYDQLDAGCRSVERGRQVAGIELDFSSCNTRRTRSLNPKGVFVSTTVIISFHPQFITKVDRAYKIQCFYMEADKTVDTRLEVSMLTTDFQTQFVPMPVCRYEILDGPSGATVEFAIVGQPVYHKWSCDTETQDTFCMNVYSCFVDDTNGDQVELINDQGCAADRYLINNAEYLGDLMAGVEAHVFKYADRADLYFQCQIAILVKEPNSLCPRPACGAPAGRGAGAANPALEPAPRAPAGQDVWPLQGGSPYLPANRLKRSAMENLAGTLDVSAAINALDMSSNGADALLNSPLAEPRRFFVERQAEGFCLSHSTFATAAVAGAALVVGVVALAAFLLIRGGSKE